jgi:hypothetical protein
MMAVNRLDYCMPPVYPVTTRLALSLKVIGIDAFGIEIVAQVPITAPAE